MLRDGPQRGKMGTEQGGHRELARRPQLGAVLCLNDQAEAEHTHTHTHTHTHSELQFWALQFKGAVQITAAPSEKSHQ